MTEAVVTHEGVAVRIVGAIPIQAILDVSVAFVAVATSITIVTLIPIATAVAVTRPNNGGGNRKTKRTSTPAVAPMMVPRVVMVPIAVPVGVSTAKRLMVGPTPDHSSRLTVRRGELNIRRGCLCKNGQPPTGSYDGRSGGSGE